MFRDRDEEERGLDVCILQPVLEGSNDPLSV